MVTQAKSQMSAVSSLIVSEMETAGVTAKCEISGKRCVTVQATITSEEQFETVLDTYEMLRNRLSPRCEFSSWTSITTRLRDYLERFEFDVRRA